MATAASTTRAPRGTKILVQAFFTAADEIPETNRTAVLKAALTAIRDRLKAGREEVAAAKAKGKTIRRKAAPKKIGRPKGSKNKPAKVVRLTTRRKSVTTQAPKQAPKSMAA